VLALLVERAGALGGFLYARVGDGWGRICGTPGLDAPDNLDATVLERLTDVDDPVTEAMSTDDAPTAYIGRSHPITSSDGRHLVSCLLADAENPSERIVGVAVLAVAPDALIDIPTTSIAAAARALAPRVHIAV